MKKPKYSIGDAAWLLHRGLLHRRKIVGILVGPGVQYAVEFGRESLAWVDQDDLYPTKEDLIATVNKAEEPHTN